MHWLLVPFVVTALQDPPKAGAKTVEERLDALEKGSTWRLDSPENIKVYWKDGLRFTTNDKKIDVKIGGRLQFEGMWASGEEDLDRTSRYSGNSGNVTAGNTALVGPLDDGFEIRRARLYLSGTAHEHFEFKVQFDLAKGATTEKDVYGGLYNLGDGIPNLRVGHQFEPFGLENQTSSFEHTFIERTMTSLAFGPARNPGFLLWKNLKVENEERLTWGAGVFREDGGDNGVATGDGAYALTGRLTGTPWWVEKGKRFLHLGVSGTRREVAGRGSEGVTYASKPEADLLNTFLSTGAMREADVDYRFGAETAFFWDALSAQAEYIKTHVDMNASSSTIENSSFGGWYAQVAWTITGEPRRWNAAQATYVNPKPSTNAFDNGAGAWEVAARYSTIDLNDGTKPTGVQGGSCDVITLALNWYLNPNTKFMFGVSRADLDTDDPALGKGGAANIFQTRMQFMF